MCIFYGPPCRSLQVIEVLKIAMQQVIFSQNTVLVYCFTLKVIDQKPQYLEMAGNLIPVAKTEEQLNVVFRAFTENRLAFLVRIRDPTREPTARLSFMREPRESRGQNPVCSVVVTLPEFTPIESTTDDVQRTKTCQSPTSLRTFCIVQYASK